MAKWYIYVDDERTPDFKTYIRYLRSSHIHGSSTPIIVRDYNSAIECIDNIRELNGDIILDLDHDIGLGKTGYDICKYIVENQYQLLGFHIHSMNPVGASNMQQLLSRYGYTEF